MIINGTFTELSTFTDQNHYFTPKNSIFHNFSGKNVRLSFIHCTHYLYTEKMPLNSVRVVSYIINYG